MYSRDKNTGCIQLNFGITFDGKRVIEWLMINIGSFLFCLILIIIFIAVKPPAPEQTQSKLSYYKTQQVTQTKPPEPKPDEKKPYKPGNNKSTEFQKNNINNTTTDEKPPEVSSGTLAISATTKPNETKTANKSVFKGKAVADVSPGYIARNEESSNPGGKSQEQHGERNDTETTKVEKTELSQDIPKDLPKGESNITAVMQKYIDSAKILRIKQKVKDGMNGMKFDANNESNISSFTTKQQKIAEITFRNGIIIILDFQNPQWIIKVKNEINIQYVDFIKLVNEGISKLYSLK